MARETPLWLQAGEYPARLDRLFIDEVFRQKNRVMRGLKVAQRAAGANFTVDVSAGTGTVRGTSQADQGMYLIRSTAVESVVCPATPVAARTDMIVATVNDPNGGGAAGDNWVLAYVVGTVAPANSLVLAHINRVPGEAAILNAAILDKRPLGEWSWTVGTTAPGATLGVEGDLYVQCP